MLTIEQIKSSGWLIFEVITGSRAYGLHTPSSDIDIRGVYVLPKDLFYSMGYQSQVSNETNDIVYYELERFMELLLYNNPNIMELLSVPGHCVVHKSPVMDEVRSDLFLSKLCENTFANYAFTQIKKAYGLEKKIVNPMEAEKKTVLDFCYVYEKKEAVALKAWLVANNLLHENVGLSAVTHLRDCYNLFYSPGYAYSGIIRTENSNEVHLSSIPKSESPLAMLYFNRDAYSVFCKKYKEYWNWVEKRNDERYKTTMTHGKKYDSKNMMHVFRLLLMAKEIALERKINVLRHDKDFLLSIKEGKFEYEELVEMAVELKNELPVFFQTSGLPQEPDKTTVNKLLINMREICYKGNR